MQSRIIRARGIYCLSRHFTPPTTSSSLHVTRVCRRPLIFELSVVTASVLTASVFSPFLFTLTTFAMDHFSGSQAALVRHLKRTFRITSTRVERTLLAVDRRHFVDRTLAPYIVYQDIPIPIGFNETISAPHMHATCLEYIQEYAVDNARILDVGSGSGYLTACLGIMAGPNVTVLGIEKHKELAERSIFSIKQSNPELLNGPSPRVKILAGNVLSKVLNEMEPFDVIHVGAAALTMPENLVEKLKPGGRMIIPVGPRSSYQNLVCVDKDQSGQVTQQTLMQVRYVPLTTPSEGSDSVPVS